MLRLAHSSRVFCGRLVRLFAVMAMSFAAVFCARGQGVEVAAGASSLTGVNGVTLTHYAGDRVSMMSFGGNRAGFVLGGATELHRRDGVTRYGDTAMGFVLPTDLDAAGRSVGARGVQWKQGLHDGSLEVFAGKTGEQFGMGYLQSVDPQRWGASVVLQKQWTPALRFQALGAAGAAHAALLSAAWTHKDRAEVAATTGWNAGAGIFAVSAKLRGESWSVRVSETLGHLQLRPATQVLSELHVPEREGVNFQVEKRFTDWLQGDGSRVAYGKDAEGGLPDGARLHEAGLTAKLGDVQAGVRGLESSDGGNRTLGFASLARWTHGVWSVDALVAESWRRGSARSGSMMVEGSREFASRVKTTAGVDVANGSPSLVAGAELLGRWGSVGVNERMVYVPFGAQAGFAKVTELHVRLHPRGVETSVTTLVGRGLPWTYTAVGEHFVETRAGGADEAGVRLQRVDLPKYVVRGRVVDEAGAPVAAAAVRVNDRTVWTGAEGEWEFRERRPEDVRVRVATEEFLTSRRYMAVETESAVAAGLDGEAEAVELHVRQCRGCSVALAERGPAAAEIPVARRATVSQAGEQDLAGLLRSSWPPLKRLARMVWRGDLR